MQAVHKSECPGGAGHCLNKISDVPHHAAALIVAGKNGEDNPRLKFVLLRSERPVVDSQTAYTLAKGAIRSSLSEWQRAGALEERSSSWEEGHD